MTLAVRIAVGFATAGAVTYIATPYAIKLADRLQFYDQPVGYKGHAQPTPYLGGAALVAGLLVALAMTSGDWGKTAPLIGCVLALWVVGTIDDRRTLSPGLRVLVEFAMAVTVWAAGLGWHVHAGEAVELALTCLWVLGVVNAFNLFDNMDGAASTMAAVVSAGAALIGVVRGDAWLAAASASLCGACLGFLPRNLSLPARIFLGDGGSMPMGFAVAVLVMVAAGTSTVAWHSLLVALLLIGVPALDTSLVIVSRRRRGVSVLMGGRDHLTHRARTFLPDARAVALSLGAIQAALSVVAVLASRGETSLVVISASLYVLAAGATIIWLDGHKVEEFATSDQDAARGRLGLSKRAISCIVVLGLGAGLSPFFFTYYDTSTWVPVGLGLTLLCAIAIVLARRRPAGPAAVTLGGLLGLGLWSLGSSAWSEAVESAVVSGNRWLVYGALLVLLLVLVSHDRRAAVLLGAAALGVGAVAVSVLARLLGDDPGALFLGARLNSPLGYINGEGCLFVIGFWLSLAAAEFRRALVAGPALAVATLMACLALLSQSRGTALAMLGSLVVVLVLVPWGTRRAYSLLVVAGGVALATPDLLSVYDYHLASAVPVDVAHAAGRAALIAAVAVCVAWSALSAGWERAGSRPQFAARARRTACALLVVPVAIALVLGAISVHRIERDVRTQWRSFVHLSEPGENALSSSASHSRLLSGAGNRYDYWRIAWRIWQAHPLLGVGAGNYPRSYYERRATTEDIQQPHSLELQVLSELGLVGALLLGAFLTGVGWGAVRMRRRAPGSPLRLALMTGGIGAFAAWLVQASVDWMHLLPGLSAIALAGSAVLIWSSRPARTPEASIDPAPAGGRRSARRLTHRPAAALGVAGVILSLIVTGASLSRQGLADLYRTRAQGELSRHPAIALVDATRSLDIDADAPQSYYIKAAALARFDQAPAAEAALVQALAREPGNFVTWTLLGDIAVRQRDLGVAKRDYLHAQELNPRDPILQELSRAPGVALR